MNHEMERVRKIAIIKKKNLSPPESTRQTHESSHEIMIILQRKENEENHETQFFKKPILNYDMGQK